MINQYELKLKVWDKIEGKMYVPELVNFIDRQAIVRQEDERMKILRFHNISIIKFIGMKDFYGQEIYEGDVLEAGDGEREIAVQFEGIYKWGIHAIMGDLIRNKWLKVIGNIFESPDLKEK